MCMMCKLFFQFDLFSCGDPNMFQSLGLGGASPQQVFELGDREPPAKVDLKRVSTNCFLKMLIWHFPKCVEVGRALRRQGGELAPSSGRSV